MQGAGRRRIYLMRHGHVDYFDPSITDPRAVPLTDEGRRQAEAGRDALHRIQFDLAVSSGLPRTRETAEIVLSGRDEAPALADEPGLEELKSGWIKASSREELAARLAYAFDDAASEGARFMPDGETFAGAEAIIIAAFNRLVLERCWRTALFVAHEGVNRILLSRVCGAGLAAVTAFEQDLCCINILDVDVTPAATGEGLQIERAILKAVNLTPYDYLKAGLPRTSLEHLFDVDFGGARPANGRGA
jgi:probable phosphoglycerate mutase